MFTVYVLKSLRNGKRYVGFTSKLAEARLREHNSGSNRFTRQNGPFRLLYTECFQPKKEAMAKEKFFKSGQGRKVLDNQLPGS